MDRQYTEKLIKAGMEAAKRKFAASQGCSLSLRDPATDLIYITSSEADCGRLAPEDIVVLDLDGVTIEGARKKSMDYYLHALIYQDRPDVQAIIHTDAMDTMVFSIMHEEIPVITFEQANVIGGSVKCAQYALPGSRELAVNAHGALGNARACLLANNGAICIGSSFADCLQVVSVLESTARIYRHVLAIGNPIAIPLEDLHKMLGSAPHQNEKEQ